MSDNAPTTLWERRRAFFEEWIESNQDSQAAKIALATFYKDYAWRARGSGRASAVTEEGWRLMGERLAIAADIIGLMIDEEKVTDPMLYQTAIIVLIGAGAPPSVFDNVVADSLELAPGFWGTLDARAHSLLPRWHGQTGDWEAFAKFIAEENAGHGIEQYARLVFERYSRAPKDVVFERLDKELLKKSIRVLLKKHPESVSNLSRAAFIATIMKDRDFANECFDLLGDRCVPAVWEVNGRMTHYRNWARTGKW